MPDAHSTVSLTQLIAIVKALSPQMTFWTEIAKWSPLLAAIVAGVVLWRVTNRQLSNSQRLLAAQLRTSRSLQREQLRDARRRQRERALRRAMASWCQAGFRYVDAQSDACEAWLRVYNDEQSGESFAFEQHETRLRRRRARLDAATLAALAEAPSGLREKIRSHIEAVLFELVPTEYVEPDDAEPIYRARQNNIEDLYSGFDRMLDDPAVSPPE